MSHRRHLNQYASCLLRLRPHIPARLSRLGVQWSPGSASPLPSFGAGCWLASSSKAEVMVGVVARYHG